jgi:hypothetical protein
MWLQYLEVLVQTPRIAAPDIKKGKRYVQQGRATTLAYDLLCRRRYRIMVGTKTVMKKPPMIRIHCVVLMLMSFLGGF